MKIQQYRFGSRLDFQRYIDPRAMDFAIPKLLFQPLLENAIKYGEDEEGKLAISFKVSVTDNQLMILVKDKGKGMEAGTLQELLDLLQSHSNETDHRGLFNVQRRVQLLYGEEYGLQIDCPPEGGTEISLRLPGVLKKKDEVKEDG
jgi:two-component system sensor histidine kinase YesM